jgi:uncharacterized protein YdeI (YjbR/CyaY-like superfamily)
MEKFDKKVDEYIARSAAFAQPVLEHWRALVHKTCPEVVEAIKWGIPHFDYKGDMMCVMASYKNHCSFTFLKAPLMSDPGLKENARLKPIQRFMGKITSLSDLPPDKTFIALLKEAMDLNKKGIKIQREKTEAPAVIEIPGYFAKQLNSNPKAKEIFETKSPSFRKNYLTWITEAKTDATREKRMTKAMGWIAEGKDRFWQFKK